MTDTIAATDADGGQVEVRMEAVRALAAVQAAPDKTSLFLDDAVVTADGRYEDLMAQFAAAWPRYSLRQPPR